MSRLRLLVFVALLSAASALNADGLYTFSHLAGAPPSLADIAPLDHPYDVAVDAAGNVYVADTFNHVVRKLSAAGLTVVAGGIGIPGTSDGNGTAARFHSPKGLSVDAAGNIYVADSSNDTIRRISPSGDVTTLAGSAGNFGSTDGQGGNARFDGPSGTAVDSQGNVFVTDTNNFTIRKITPSGVVTTFAGTAGSSGGADGTGSAARFNYPNDLALDSAGNLYVADSINNQIRKISRTGQVTTLAGASFSGSDDGHGSAARFQSPRDVAVDASGVVYVADQQNQTIRRITPSGDVTTFAGKAGVSGAVDGVGDAARFSDPWGLAVDLLGNVYVADTENMAVRKITPERLVSTLGALAMREGSADGNGANARFHMPSGIAIDSLGNAFVADTDNHTIRKIAPNGEVTTFAGTAGASGRTNGTGADARFNFPQGIAIDGQGNLYVADNLNYVIRKITPSAVVTTYAGNGSSGSNDGTAATARFYFPDSVAVDSLGNVYVADTGNETIRVILPTGEVKTLAGLARTRGTADGSGSAARFDEPSALAVDSSGNVFVADAFNGAIRKITPAGDVTTYAGVAGTSGGRDGIGSAARLQAPRGIAIAADGTLFVADGHVIRRITTAREVTTIAGVFGAKGDQDGTGAGALFNSPNAIAVDTNGKVYLADTWNNAIRTGVAAKAPPKRRALRP